MKKFLTTLLILWFSVSVLAQTVNIKIIETTDTHGQIYPYDFNNDRNSNSSLSQINSYVKEERAKENQSVILLSGGDILQGTPAVYYYNYEDTAGTHLYAAVMNYMGYDAGTVGNHDIETGHAVYDKFRKQVNFPWLAANAVRVSDGMPYFQPYTVINKSGVKIAVLGLITPHIPHWLPEKIWKGIEFEDMIEAAKKWIGIIKVTEKPDLIIGLFHSGVEYSYGEQKIDTYKNENASQLVAEQVPGFDIVFVGHDHHSWNKTVTNTDGREVLILGGTNSARTIAVADVICKYDSSIAGWSSEIKGQTIDARNFEVDTVFFKQFYFPYLKVKEYVSKPIGGFLSTISTRDAMFGSSEFCDLINKIQMELTGADISFTAPLAHDAKINAGTVYVRDMFNLYRYENLLYSMKLTGKEIQGYLEYTAANWFNIMNNENDHLLNFIKDEKGVLVQSERSGFPMLKERYYNFDAALGLNYTVDVSKPEGGRVTITSMSNGSEFNMNATYLVAVNSYRGNGGGGHLIEGAGIPLEELEKRVVTSTEKDLRYYMMKWIENKGEVKPVSYNNWKIIPENWWVKAKEKDYKLLFPD